MDSISGLGQGAAERDEHSANLLRMRRVAVIGLVAWPLFGLVDWFIVSYVHAGNIWFYITLRLAGMLLIGLAATRLFARPAPGPRMLRGMEVLVFTTATVLISAASLEYRGIASPLALGVITVMICRSAVLSDHWKQGVLPIGAMALGYPATMAVLASVSPKILAQFSSRDEVAAFVLNLLFILGAALITLAGGHAVWALRRQVFESRSFGRYRLRQRIGQGSMGEVWSAHHRTLKRDVAVKIMRHDSNQPDVTQARFEREVEATAALSHPNTVRVFDFGVTDDGMCYFAMELLKGRDLGKILERESVIEPHRAAHIVRQAALALTEAHGRGIVHRDLKPANIFITAVAGEADLVKVLDFGLARLSRSDDPGLTYEGWAVGTPSYISPEVLKGEKADPRSDVYSLGAILYTMLCGSPPFEADDVYGVFQAHLEQPPVPVSERMEAPLSILIEGVVMRCLDKVPERRFGSAMELAEAMVFTADADWEEAATERTVDPT